MNKKQFNPNPPPCLKEDTEGAKRLLRIAVIAGIAMLMTLCCVYPQMPFRCGYGSATPETGFVYYYGIMESPCYSTASYAAMLHYWQTVAMQLNAQQNAQFVRFGTNFPNRMPNRNFGYATQQPDISLMQQIYKEHAETFANAANISSRVLNGWTSVLSGSRYITHPYTGERIQISNQYKHTWVNNCDDEIIQTDSSTDPNEDPETNSRGREWKETE